MCFESVAWAIKQKIRPSSLKFALIVLADCANASNGMKLWPSLKYVADAACQDIKTIRSNIEKLVALGYLVDTGERAGLTKQIIVYRLNLDICKDTKSGSVNSGVGTQDVDKKDTENGMLKGYRFSPERLPKRGGKDYQKSGSHIYEPIKESNNNLPQDFNLFEKKLHIAGMESSIIKRWFSGNSINLNSQNQQIIYCKSKFEKDWINQRYDLVLSKAFPLWVLEIKMLGKERRKKEVAYG